MDKLRNLILNLHINKTFLPRIVVPIFFLVSISFALVIGYYLGRETEGKSLNFKRLEQLFPTTSPLQTSERCEDTKMINNEHPQIKIKGVLGLLEAHCGGLIFQESKSGGFREGRFIYSAPSVCQIVSSLMSPNNNVLAFYVGDYPNYQDYSEDGCSEKGLYFFNVETEKLIRGPLYSSIRTILIPTFWSSDSEKIYCEVERPWGEGCQPLEVVTPGWKETKRTSVCGYFFQAESKPDDIIHLTSSDKAPVPCYGIKIKDQISRFNAKTGENLVLFELENAEDLTILEVFDNNRYVLVKRTKIEEGSCEGIPSSSYSIFDTDTKTVKNIEE